MGSAVAGYAGRLVGCHGPVGTGAPMGGGCRCQGIGAGFCDDALRVPGGPVCQYGYAAGGLYDRVYGLRRSGNLSFGRRAVLAPLDHDGGRVRWPGLFGQRPDWHCAARHGVVCLAVVGAALAPRVASAVSPRVVGLVAGGCALGSIGATAPSVFLPLFFCHAAFSTIYRDGL